MAVASDQRAPTSRGAPESAGPIQENEALSLKAESVAGPGTPFLTATTKYLARSNKSCARGDATKKRAE
jgi:hypothetical protein